MNEKPVIVWMWRYHSLSAEVFDTLDEALGYAYSVSEHGEGSLSSIETIDGQVERSVIDRYEDARDSEQKEEFANRPTMTHRVTLTSPNSEEVGHGAYPDETAALAALDDLPAWLRASGRARITEIQ